MIHVTVTALSNLLADDQMVQLGLSIQALVAQTLDVPDDKEAQVRPENVSVEFRSYTYGINLRAIRIVIEAPAHPYRCENHKKHHDIICAALRSCSYMPSRSITDRKGGVSVGLVLVPSMTMHL